jgi:hypothetical protein
MGHILMQRAAGAKSRQRVAPRLRCSFALAEGEKARPKPPRPFKPGAVEKRGGPAANGAFQGKGDAAIDPW